MHDGSGRAAEQRAEAWISMEKGLPRRRRLGPDFDDYCLPLDDRLGRRLGPDFDDYCFPMDDRMDHGSGA